MKPTVVVAGSVAQKPHHGGHTWVFLQYLLGLRRLGWDVTFLDRLDPTSAVDELGDFAPPARSFNARHLAAVMESFGLAGTWSVLLDGTGETLGLERREVLERVRDAELLLNVMGFLADEELLAAARRRVFLDIDPGFGQMWRELGLADVFAGHDAFVTIGRNLGRDGCTLPNCGLPWITTNQPVVLDHWPAEPPPAGGPFTSIASWRGRYAPIDFAGTTYGLRVHEMRKLAPLPRVTGAEFELALDIDPAEGRDLALLADNGWRLVEPRRVAADPWAYQRYIAASGAELMVAKGIYVQSRSGWFSDRSICYLASGRPVVAQDTGFAGNYPLGEGLLAFDDLAGARAAVEAVVAEPQRHARAARRVAEDVFDSDKVLSRLLDELGATP
jgi:hypothetical protein